MYHLALGAAGVLVGFPLDTVKVRIQTQDPSKGIKYTGTFQCLRSIIRQEGVSQKKSRVTRNAHFQPLY